MRLNSLYRRTILAYTDEDTHGQFLWAAPKGLRVQTISESYFFFFRMPYGHWLSFASHLNPSPNFVFFSSFVPYRITNPNKFLFIGEPSDFDNI